MLAIVMAVDPGNLEELIQLAGSLWAQAQWAPLVALCVVVITTLLTRIGGATVLPWLDTRVGKLVVAAVSAVALSVLQALIDGGSIAAVVSQAITALVLAIGMHSGAKNLGQGNAPEVGG